MSNIKIKPEIELVNAVIIAGLCIQALGQTNNARVSKALEDFTKTIFGMLTPELTNQISPELIKIVMEDEFRASKRKN